MLIPRKRCPKCHSTFEGAEVEHLYSCDICGCGYLTTMPTLDTEQIHSQAPEPRGGGGTIIHVRDGY